MDEDAQVLVPLRHLATEGVIGEVAPQAVSFMGHQPDASRVVEELIPAIVLVAEVEQPHAALLVPA